jgi:hypothetical protein
MPTECAHLPPDIQVARRIRRAGFALPLRRACRILTRDG